MISADKYTLTQPRGESAVVTAASTRTRQTAFSCERAVVLTSDCASMPVAASAEARSAVTSDPVYRATPAVTIDSARVLLQLTDSFSVDNATVTGRALSFMPSAGIGC